MTKMTSFWGSKDKDKRRSNKELNWTPLKFRLNLTFLKLRELIWTKFLVKFRNHISILPLNQSIFGHKILKSIYEKGNFKVILIGTYHDCICIKKMVMWQYSNGVFESQFKIYLIIMACKIIRFRKLRWQNIMKSTKSQTFAILYIIYIIDIDKDV